MGLDVLIDNPWDPYHPQTQGKIEKWHQTLKNRILLDNYFFPADLEAQIESFVDHYNHQRYHESINNLTPADVILRARAINFKTAGKDQTENYENPVLAIPQTCRLTLSTR